MGTQTDDLDEETIDSASDTGADLTAAERTLVQQLRNSGVKADEALKRIKNPAGLSGEPAASAKGMGAGASTAALTPEAVAKEAAFAAEYALVQRDLNDAARRIVGEYETLKADPADLKQIRTHAAETLRARADYKDLRDPERMTAAYAEEVKKECERRTSKGQAAGAAKEKAEAEAKLAKQRDAVEGAGKSSSRSAPNPAGTVAIETINENVFGREAKWPANEAAFLAECRAGDEEYLDRVLGRKT